MLFTVCSSFTDLHAILLQDNVNHCTANTTIAYNFQRLEKGVLFAIEDFVVRANKEEYRVRKNNNFKLEFDGKAHLRKTSILYDQYVRYPLEKVHIENMKPTRNKSLIGKFVLII
jgi:hypothetical protein